MPVYPPRHRGLVPTDVSKVGVEVIVICRRVRWGGLVSSVNGDGALVIGARD